MVAVAKMRHVLCCLLLLSAIPAWGGQPEQQPIPSCAVEEATAAATATKAKSLPWSDPAAHDARVRSFMAAKELQRCKSSAK